MDLYYLMDLSKSMEDDKEKLSALGDLLAETMQNITSNFRLQFTTNAWLLQCKIQSKKRLLTFLFKDFQFSFTMVSFKPSLSKDYQWSFY